MKKATPRSTVTSTQTRVAKSTAAVATLTPVGELTQADVSDMCDLLKSLSTHGTTAVILDLARVTHVDYRALAQLGQWQKQLVAHGGEIRLCHVSAKVRLIFRVANLSSSFSEFESYDAAVRSFAGHDGKPA